MYGYEDYKGEEGFEGYVKTNTNSPVYDPSFKLDDTGLNELERIALLMQKLNGFTSYIRDSFEFIANKFMREDELKNYFIKTILYVETGEIVFSFYNKNTKAIIEKRYAIYDLLTYNDSGALQEILTLDFKQILNKSKDEIYSENTVFKIF